MSNLSIIIPVYNKEKYLKRCLSSIINQKYTDFELILINDGSTDKSSEICREFANVYPKITFINQENMGVSTARNRGLEIVSGKYVSFIDADDFVDPDMYIKMIGKAEETGADLVVCGNNYFDENMEYKWSGQIGTGEYCGEELYGTLYSMPNPIGGGCCNKVFAIKDRSIRFNKDIKIGEDWLFLFDFYHQCQKAVHIPDCLYNVIESNDSATRNNNADRIMMTLKSSAMMLENAKTISKKVENMAVDKYLDDCLRYGQLLDKKNNKKLRKLIKYSMLKIIISAYIHNNLTKNNKHKYIVGMISL